MRIAVTVLVFGLWARPAAAQWSFLSDKDQLKGKAISDVGTLSTERTQPALTRVYDPVLKMDRYQSDEPREYLLFQGARTVCFPAAPLRFGSLRSYAAAILIDDAGKTYLAVFEASIGDIDVKVKPARPIECLR
jgi:hypothetical protein